MSEEVESAAQAAALGARPDRTHVRAFAEIYAAHAAHVFDYCLALVGSDAVAASATRAALVAGWQPPQASHLLRARLIAAARQEALACAAAGSSWPGAGAARLEAADAALGDALRHLPAGQREVLALVYRHDIWPDQLPAVLEVSGRDAYARLAAAEHDFVTAATAALEDIGAAPLATVPGSVWRDAVAELTAGTRGAAALPPMLLAGQPDRSLAVPRRRMRLIVAAALPAVAVGCWAILAGVGSAHSVGVHDAGEPSAISMAPRSSGSTATPDGAGTVPAKQGTVPVRQGSAPVIPVLALLPSTAAGTVLPVTTTAATGADQTPQTSPSVSSSPSLSPSPSSSPSLSPSSSPSESPSSAAPSPSGSASASSPSSSVAPSTSPSASSSSASPSVPDPSPG